MTSEDLNNTIYLPTISSSAQWFFSFLSFFNDPLCPAFFFFAFFFSFLFSVACVTTSCLREKPSRLQSDTGSENKRTVLCCATVVTGVQQKCGPPPPPHTHTHTHLLRQLSPTSPRPTPTPTPQLPSSQFLHKSLMTHRVRGCNVPFASLPLACRLYPSVHK